MVEFALVIPVFLLIVIAILDVGRGVFAYNSITNGAREGARLAIVNQTSTSIISRAVNQVAVAETDVPNVTVAFKESAPNANYANNPTCAPLKIGCVAIVTFQTTFKPLTPVVAQILFSNGVTLTATSVEAIEYVCPNPTVAAGSCPKQP